MGQHITELVDAQLKGHFSLLESLVVLFNKLFLFKVDLKAHLLFLFVVVTLVEL